MIGIFDKPTVITVPALNAQVNVTYTSQPGWDLLFGIAFEFGQSALADSVYTDILPTGMQIDSNYFLPNNYDVKRLVSGVNVPPCLRFCFVKVPINCNGSTFTFNVQNTNSAAQHQIKLYTWLANQSDLKDLENYCSALMLQPIS